jgi:hypothetical protein
MKHITLGCIDVSKGASKPGVVIKEIKSAGLQTRGQRRNSSDPTNHNNHVYKIAWRFVDHWISRLRNPRNQMRGTTPADNSCPMAGTRNLAVNLNRVSESRFGEDLLSFDGLLIRCGKYDDNGPAWMGALLRNFAVLVEGGN